MITHNRKLRVFLCHASQDKPIAIELYQKLVSESWVDPWLDKEKLRPGQSWEIEIEKAINAADVVIVCVSQVSIKKAGFLQRELRIAINKALEIPEEEIYIIPLRLDDCDMPIRLQKFQYLNYFPLKGREIEYNRLIGSLQIRAKSLNISVPSDSNKISKPIDVYATNTIGDIEFVRVASGEFLMGSKLINKRAYPDESPQHVVHIPYDYWIGRYPVTVEHYAEFVEWTGYSFTWYKDWRKKLNHPVKNITFKHAQVFIEWLNEKYSGQLPKNYEFKLPTEAEWEKAARGVDGREWPWGDRFYKARCNTKEGGIGNTTPVGYFSPLGDSPLGISDVAGNVWEWTISKYRPYVDKPISKSSRSYVVRGGSYYDSSINSRCAYRYKCSSRTVRVGNFGFRVVIVPRHKSKA